MSTSLDGGTLVLYSVAAAVIGGTSLFGGRGRAVNAVLGGLVIAAIDNGMGLQGYSGAAQKVVTALVLLAAVTIDAVARSWSHLRLTGRRQTADGWRSGSRASAIGIPRSGRAFALP